MKLKMKFKICVDIAMTIALLASMAYLLIGEEAHEWIGTGMFLLFIIHNGLNWKWYRNLFKGSYTWQRTLDTWINLLCLLSMVGIMVSGIIFSKYVFYDLAISGLTAFARTAHMLCSYWGFLFMSLHLGNHWTMLILMMKKAIGIKELPKVLQNCLRFAGFLIACYGAVSFIKHNLYDYMFLKIEFVFFDIEQSLVLFFIDYLAMTALWIWLITYLRKFITYIQNNKKSKLVPILLSVSAICGGLLLSNHLQLADSVSSKQNDANIGPIIDPLEPVISATTSDSESVDEATSSDNEQTIAVIPDSEPENEIDMNEHEVESNILIAYFTWADNTVVNDVDEALQSALNHYEAMGDQASSNSADSVSSASVVPPGNAARIAEWIQQEIGGDLFSIQTVEAYPSIYDDCLERASNEKAENARPALSTHVENMDQYDTIFIGYPNWWYSCPMALLSFIEEYDLSGKTIVLFCTHGTGGLASSVRDITNALPEDCIIIDNVLSVYRSEATQSQGKVLSWINELINSGDINSHA